MSRYINYRDLPPGRSRALAYSREIELANLQELNEQNENI